MAALSASGSALTVATSDSGSFPLNLFGQYLLDHLSDGVIFVDRQRIIRKWSKGAEKATGLVENAVLSRVLTPQVISLADSNGIPVTDERCPVAHALQSREIVTGEYRVASNSSQGLKVELTAVPVIDDQNCPHGVVVMFHDRTEQIDLQRQLKDLYEFSVLDPLTQVANRAEFERVLEEYVRAFSQSDRFHCSIIICDIDFFKSINDKFGHVVGDEALVSFAGMLKKYVRAQDLVARYGGEEFVILCADCDRESAIERAEEIRVALYRTPQPMLEGKAFSASFGVSELRDGDTAMDFFVRADTALLKAKETGRNRVVASEHAGSGRSPMAPEPTTTSSPTGIQWKTQRRENTAILCEEFQTTTPLPMLVEKLRGFIVETDAVLQRVDTDFLSMEVEYEHASHHARKGVFTVNIDLKEGEIGNEGRPGSRKVSYIRVMIFAARMRKWFATNHLDVAPLLMAEVRRYLMISDKSSRLTADMATENTRQDHSPMPGSSA